MLTICKNDKLKVKELLQQKKLNAIVASNSDFVDEIILAMVNEGVVDCLDDGFVDKRRHNSFVPFKLIMTLAIAAKMKIRTSLTDIPYAIQDHRTLAELGYNVILDGKDELFTEGTIRHLIGKCTDMDLINYYNRIVQDNICKQQDIEPNIHILDCTKIAVNFDNENYENSTIAIDRKGNKMRGYKLASLRGLYKDSGIIEEICFGTAAVHDLALCENMLYTTKCLKHGDILINDRGFLSREMMNHLKTYRGVDTYIPLRNSMNAFEEAIAIAKEQNIWLNHPNVNRVTQVVSFVPNIGYCWNSKKAYEDVPINACVVWDKETMHYSVFVTTDTEVNAYDMLNVYELRPEIEEDFRQLKDFWRMEDFKSTKYHLIVFHIICVLLGYLFYQLYINNSGERYLGRSLPVILKKYKANFFNQLVLYSDNHFCCMTMKEFLEFRDSCNEEVQRFLLRFFD